MLTRTLALLLVLGAPAFADAPQIQNINVVKSGGLWRFDVTILHGDTGWDHYVDAWRVVDMNGRQLGLRDLAHPHVDEQPFTRSLSGVTLPDDVTEVGIQARDSTTGWAEVKKIKIR